MGTFFDTYCTRAAQKALAEMQSQEFTDQTKDSVMDCYDRQYSFYKIEDVHKTMCNGHGFDDWERTYRELFLFLETHYKYVVKLFEIENTNTPYEVIVSETVALCYMPKSEVAKFKCLENTVMEIKKSSGLVYSTGSDIFPGKSVYHSFECSENPSSPWMVEIREFLNDILPNLRTYQKSLSKPGIFDAHRLRLDIISGHKTSCERKEDHKNMSDACLTRTN